MGTYSPRATGGRENGRFWKRRRLLRAFLAYLVSFTLVFPAWIFPSIAPGTAHASTPPDPAEYTINAIPGYFIDMTATGTQVLPPLGDEDAKGAVPIGFNFEFFGSLFNSAAITSNGYLTFGIDVEPENRPLPDTSGPNGLIAPFWDDLDPSLSPGSEIFYGTQGTAPRRRFVATWKEVALKVDPDSRLTFQLILFEGTNEIQFHYLSMIDGAGTSGAGRDSGSSASIGIENIDGTKGKQVSFKQDGRVAAGSAFSFTLAGNAHEAGRSLGDLNADGALTVNDQYLLARQRLGDSKPITSSLLSLSDVAPHPGIGGRAFGDGIIDGQDNTRLIDAIMRRLDLNPTISDLSYIAAAPGETLTVSGSGFDPVAANNTVRFLNVDGSEIGVIADTVNGSGTELTVTVPTGTRFISVSVEQDGQLSNAADFIIEGAPTITALTPDLDIPGNSVRIKGFGFGFAPGDNQVSFNGLAATVESADTAGVYDELVVTVPPGVSSGPVTVTTTAQTSNGVTFTLDGPPAITIDSPDDKDQVATITDVFGTVNDANLAAYTVEYARIGEGFSVIDSGFDNVSSDVLGQLDPTLLMNGLYRVRVTAWDENGNTSMDSRDVMVTGFNKPGVFTLAFTDLNVPVSGVPITVTRIYDSRSKFRGDFGIGWDLDLRHGSFIHNRIPGDAWYFTSSLPPFPVPCQRVRETQTHITEVNISETEYYFFTPHMVNTTGTLGGCFADVAFQSIGGSHTGAELEILGNTEVYYQNGSNRVVNATDFSPFNPTQVRLKTLDGREFDFVLGEGMTRLQDANGNALFISDDGIVHSSGKSVAFERDGEGRIIRITDPLGNSILYAYDSSGDLVGVTDRENYQTQFVYDADHYLIDIINPAGVRAVRSEYDEDGRLVATIDAEGNRIEQIHDIDNRREIIREAGATRIIEYDEQGNITREVDEEGSERRWTYDVDGNILTETNPLGGVTTYVYDANGYLLTQTDPLGSKTEYTRNTIGKILSIKDPNLNVTTLAYDSVGNPLTVQNAKGDTSSFTYDATGNMSSRTDFNGNITNFEYDAYGNTTRITDAEGNQSFYSYDLRGKVLSKSRVMTTPSGPRTLTTNRVYNPNGRQVAETHPDTNQIGFEYDHSGNRTAIVNPLGGRIEQSFNVAGKMTEVVYSDGLADGFIYDRLKTLSTYTGRSGRSNTYLYDRTGKPLEIVFPDDTPADDTDNPKISYEYGLPGKMTKLTYLGTELEYDYDLTGRRTNVSDTLGNEANFSFDANGNLIQVTDAMGRSVIFTYDELNRRTRTDLPDGTNIQSSYDAQGNVLNRTDRAGNMTRYEYDRVNRLTAVVDSHGGRTSYAYDEIGNLVSRTDANGSVTRHEYDGMGRKIATVLPLGQRAEYIYDAAGRLKEYVNFNGESVGYTYNDVNKLVSKSYPDGTTVDFTYTPAGKREAVQDSRGTTQFVYDTNERLISRTEPDGAVIAYTYAANNKVASVSTPNGITAYTYDHVGRPLTVTDQDGGVTHYTYDAFGNPIETERPNGTIETRQYDSMNRVTLLENRDAGGALLSSYTYGFDSRGNRISVVEHSGRSVAYAYDSLNRLVSETITDPVAGTRSLTYTYDAVGNRTNRNDSLIGSTTYDYDANDRLISEVSTAGTINYTYDDNGNTLTEGDAVSYSLDYFWDAENRLIGAEVINGGGTRTASFAYNEEGIRVSTTIDGITTNYLLDTQQSLTQVLEESSSAGTETYVYGNDLISRKMAAQREYIMQDAHSGVRMLSDDTGTVTDNYEYDAFGRTLTATGGSDNSHRYRTQQQDEFLGDYYLRARYYDQSTGRFTAVDPAKGQLDNPFSFHPYLYANANPVTNHDPTGMFTLVDMLVTVSIITTIATFNGINMKAAADYFGLKFGPVCWCGELFTYATGIPGASIDIGWGGVGDTLKYKLINIGAQLASLEYKAHSSCENRGSRPYPTYGDCGEWWMVMTGVGAGFSVMPAGTSTGSFELASMKIFGVKDSVLEGHAFYSGAGAVLFSLLGESISYLTAGYGHGRSVGSDWGFDFSIGAFVGKSLNLASLQPKQCTSGHDCPPADPDHYCNNGNGGADQ